MFCERPICLITDFLSPPFRTIFLVVKFRRGIPYSGHGLNDLEKAKSRYRKTFVNSSLYPLVI